MAKGGHAWLTAIGESAALLSSVLRVIHPDLYAMARSSMDEMFTHENLADILHMWMSVFNGVSVICNRETPVHRDNYSSSEWYDMLTTIGPYESAIFELPGVGLRFPYPSGTIIGLCGRVLRHGVSVARGERVCLAYYMRKNVQDRLTNSFASWNSWNAYI
jgi:RNA polymerase subunit RPABC4/transcription elongation factor Spt4